MATTGIANNKIFANIGAYKTFVQCEKDDVKEFSKIAANTQERSKTLQGNLPNNRP